VRGHVVRARGLVKTYGRGRAAVRVLDGADLDVAAGELVAVFGRSGSGKSTLLHLLGGLDAADAGTIEVAGRPVRFRSPVHARTSGLAPVFQDPAFVPDLTVAENLRLGGLWRREGPQGAAAREVYGLFPRLDERRRQPAHTLSGGERQMLAIGRALMSRPRVLLLDEPSLGLAPRLAAQILGLLRSLRERSGLTVLLVEQNAKGALSVADRGIVLALGRIVAEDEPARLAADEKLRHAYLGF
jgi:branched-chain amino acid transport system ATP-binding protein